MALWLSLLLLAPTLCAGEPDVPGVFGIDIASFNPQSAEKWACMHREGNYSFAIIEGWRGGYQYNQHLPEQIKYAWDGGFSHVDVYAFMCPRCSNSPQSVRDLVGNLRKSGVKWGTIWLDIEQCHGCWNSAGENVLWIRSLISEYKKLGVRIGIYSSPGEWSSTVGGTHEFSEHTLWYATYDGEPNFDDWSRERFGGWSRPAMKQFADHADNSCGVSVDRNWYPA